LSRSNLYFALLVTVIVSLTCSVNAFAELKGVSESDQLADADWPMYQSPFLKDIPRVRTFNDRLPAVWKNALARQDVETRRRAAQDIGRAHRLGMTGLMSFVDPLIKQMDQPNQHPVFVLTAAKTLIDMNATSAAASLLKHNERGGRIGVIRGSTIGKAGGNGGIELVQIGRASCRERV